MSKIDCSKIIISGVGCALADFLYTNIDFSSPMCKKYLSKNKGDGGLIPGGLIFIEELEEFSNKPFSEILKEIAGNEDLKTFNLGGPSLVSLIHASQLLDKGSCEVKFYGIAGGDSISEKIFKALMETPLSISNYKKMGDYSSPFTYVFSDPDLNKGDGERTFVNNIGAAWHYTPSMLGDDFFNSQVVCLGGTALMPQIHDGLTNILKKSKENNCLTVVNTVYDFRNEKRYPGAPWPLVDKPSSIGLIDVLIMDCEEALRISGIGELGKAADYFAATGIPSFFITNGSDDIIAFSTGEVFNKTFGPVHLPVSNAVQHELSKVPPTHRDTTGCGDNFAGGLIASITWQFKSRAVGNFDLTEAVSWAVASGGFACLYIGGVYYEKVPGEKLKNVQQLQEGYLEQISG
jgi:sugar/nucleoside kinase (ribokinase family)